MRDGVRTVQSGEPQTIQSIVLPLGIGLPMAFVTWMCAGRVSYDFSKATAAGIDLPLDCAPAVVDEPRVKRDALRANDPKTRPAVLCLKTDLLSSRFTCCPLKFYAKIVVTVLRLCSIVKRWSSIPHRTTCISSGHARPRDGLRSQEPGRCLRQVALRFPHGICFSSGIVVASKMAHGAHVLMHNDVRCRPG